MSVISIDKAVAVYNNIKYEHDTVFYLFTNPTDVLRLIEAGVPIKDINIGGCRLRRGKNKSPKQYLLINMM